VRGGGEAECKLVKQHHVKQIGKTKKGGGSGEGMKG